MIKSYKLVILHRWHWIIFVVEWVGTARVLKNISWLETQVSIGRRLESLVVQWAWLVVPNARALLLPILSNDSDVTSEGAGSYVIILLLWHVILGLLCREHAMRDQGLRCLVGFFNLLLLLLSPNLIISFTGAMLKRIATNTYPCIDLPNCTLSILPAFTRQLISLRRLATVGSHFININY